jgi:hypothetical protein
MAPLPTIKSPVFIPQKAAKAKNLPLTPPYLALRTMRAVSMGYQKPKWVEFCEVALRRGFSVTLYEAKHTASKYITLRKGGKSFKVRFSNHRPIRSREAGRDCDFFVGVTNLAVTTTGDALRAVTAFFGEGA